jgi:predicted S18 family serine protease
MLNIVLNVLGFVLSSTLAYEAAINFHGKTSLLIVFMCGILVGLFLMSIKLHVKNDKINSYKRELEKETISGNENSSKVKVLESKIEVLEKALEKALKG